MQVTNDFMVQCLEELMGQEVLQNTLTEHDCLGGEAIVVGVCGEKPDMDYRVHSEKGGWA